MGAAKARRDAVGDARCRTLAAESHNTNCPGRASRKWHPAWGEAGCPNQREPVAPRGRSRGSDARTFSGHRGSAYFAHPVDNFTSGRRVGAAATRLNERCPTQPHPPRRLPRARHAKKWSAWLGCAASGFVRYERGSPKWPSDSRNGTRSVCRANAPVGFPGSVMQPSYGRCACTDRGN